MLFDLDGTLLPMDLAFMNMCYEKLVQKLVPHGYEPKELFKVIWDGTMAMLKNDGSMTNKERFWEHFGSVYGEKGIADEPIFEDFYRNEFEEVRVTCGCNPKAAQLIRKIKQSGRRVTLATNPIFPPVATLARMRWAGLDAADFDLITTYDNSRWCKPSEGYFYDVLEKIGMRPEDCVMVGNDTSDDLGAAKLGMPVFLITDCLINWKKVDIEEWPHGGFDELNAWIDTLQ